MNTADLGPANPLAKIEKKIIATPKILKSINWLRKKSNEPPLIV